MKSRLLNIFIFCLTAVLTTFIISCSDDGFKGGDSPRDESADSVYLSIGMRIGTNYVQSKFTGNDGEEQTGKDYWSGDVYGEDDISSIYMLLFNTDGGDNALLEYIFPLDVQKDADRKFTGSDVIDSDFTDSNTEKKIFQTPAKTILPGNYQLIVVANPYYDLKQKLDEETVASSHVMTISEFTTAIDGSSYFPDSFYETVNIYDPDKDENINIVHNMFMTNANGIIRIPASKLKSTPEGAVASPIFIQIERLLARVYVRRGENFKINNGELNLSVPVEDRIMWYAENTNRKTYPIRQLAFLKDGITQETPSDGSFNIANRENIYAKDPNFDNLRNATEDVLNENFFNLKNWGTYSYWVPTYKHSDTIGLRNNREYQYIFENTISLEDQSSPNWRNYTTHIVVEAYIKIDRLSSETNYYSFRDINNKWVIFSHEEAMQWVSEGFPANLTNLETAITTDAAGGEDRKFYFDEPYENNWSPGEYCTYSGITFHPQGMNKYIIPVKHFLSAEDAGGNHGYGYYGVVRNRSYIITINSLNGPGSDFDGSYISADVTVTPWYIRSLPGEDLTYE